jgi:hypothetical protein
VSGGLKLRPSKVTSLILGARVKMNVLIRLLGIFCFVFSLAIVSSVRAEENSGAPEAAKEDDPGSIVAGHVCEVSGSSGSGFDLGSSLRCVGAPLPDDFPEASAPAHDTSANLAESDE